MPSAPICALTSLMLGFFAGPGVARAGWTAKLTSSSDGPKQSAELFFDNDHFRTDAENAPTLIVELNTGKVTILNPKLKKYASVTLDEMVKLRDQNIAELKKQLPNMPPEMRKQLEDQIKLMEGQGAKAKKDLALTDQKKKDKVNGYDCNVYTWSAADGDGEACIAEKIAGVDATEFRKATAKLADKLSAISGGPSSYAMLTLGTHGFPVRTKQKLKLGDKQLEVVSEMSDIKTTKLDPAKFQPPKEYAQGDLPSVLGGVGGPH
jgi:hypothetical protein